MSFSKKTFVAACMALLVSLVPISTSAGQDAPATGITPGVVTEKMSDEDALNTVSHVIGYNAMREMLGKMKQQGIDLSPAQVLEGAKQAIAGEPLSVQQAEMAQAMGAMQGIIEKKRAAMMEEMKAKAAANGAAGKAYMEENAKKPGVQTLDNGVQYTVVTPGTGETAGPNDQVRINYHGTFVDGEVFDSSLKEMNGHGAEPIVNGASGFVKGFNAVVQKMKVGGKWNVVIPAEAAYGLGGPLGPNKTLCFEIELLEVIKGKPAGAGPAGGGAVGGNQTPGGQTP